ncbi:DUF305 domain-containing protein [Candidatus Saccharibacteria bacterium]|nr:DUF305 domain-containing protein [Candidatus Saccharibacteria bacterium]
MKKDTVLIGIAGILLGAMIATFTASAAVNNGMGGMMRMMGMNSNPTTGEMFNNSMGDHGGMSMDGMSSSLVNRTGDEFDKVFIEQMIDHHQGAIDMAELANKNAKHDEIKQMSNDIIKAQSFEINQMREWQKAWNY